MKKFWCNGKKDFCDEIDKCKDCEHYANLGGAEIEVNETQTNFDKITQSVESFIEWVLDNYYSVPEKLPCTKSCNGDCKECFKEWLQKESE